MQDKNQSTNSKKYFILFSLVFGFLTAFAGGFVLSNQLAREKLNSLVLPKFTNLISPTPTYIPTSQDTTKFLPGKHFFDDTVVIVSQNTPHINLVATVTRIEQEGKYLQNTRVSFYNGNEWKRKTESKKIPDSTIVSDSLVKDWNINLDPSRVLKQSVRGEVYIDSTNIKFDTGSLENEIGMRSLPGYTKFMSQGTGTISVNGQNYPVYILYTRIYSSNSSDIQFYTEPLGLTTDWIVFWDKKGRFYHLDSTNVTKKTPTYQTHQIGVMEDENKSVSKTFKLSITRDSKKPPTDYTAFLDSPVNTTLNFKRVNGINKSPDNSGIWYMGNIEGYVSSNNGELISGVGLVEYIND